MNRSRILLPRTGGGGVAVVAAAGAVGAEGEASWASWYCRAAPLAAGWATPAAALRVRTPTPIIAAMAKDITPARRVRREGAKPFFFVIPSLTLGMSSKPLRASRGPSRTPDGPTAAADQS